MTAFTTLIRVWNYLLNYELSHKVDPPKKTACQKNRSEKDRKKTANTNLTYIFFDEIIHFGNIFFRFYKIFGIIFCCNFGGTGDSLYNYRRVIAVIYYIHYANYYVVKR